MQSFIVKKIGNTEIYLYKYLASLNISAPFKLIKKRIVYVNNNKAKSNTKVTENDVIKIYANITYKEETQDFNDQYKIPIIFENTDFIVINKPKKIASQGGTKVNHSIDRIFVNYKLVHRLDQDTDGLMILAKTLHAAQRLTEAFKMHKIQKFYKVTAYFQNDLKPLNGYINNPDGISYYKVMHHSNKIYNLIFQPITGKKHQIRLHIKYLHGHIIGDTKYTDPNSPYRHEKSLKLQCYKIIIPGEIFNKNSEYMIEL